MRLDKFLSKATELSRKDCKKVLHAGEITVNGNVIKDGSLHIDEINDEIQWAGEQLSVATGNRYILLYKPDGFECALKPKEYPIVTDLIVIPELASLRIVGRLDVDTTGALLLSDDGGFVHKVTSPKHHVDKVYHLTLADSVSDDLQQTMIKAIAQGIVLDGESEKTAPAVLMFTDDTHATLTLTEGKYHQVKRMMAYFGNKVIKLHRSSIGMITLDGLQMGECRFLTAEEIEQF
ncbi:ribosomal small subunit pseudouridine synthase A [Moraxella macacae 0408225]|uniref:Pseudouridine synthase n=1 Tax=Moraxella macacae 0408225 TaxID=1230338 RepID=L2F813_9GAMM|nr:pseudouridine synthase [Moraxella macacae]ELA09204.1 ribosomal small subunit pseudouridine synthase A [Moraxella macacae 0408225]